MKIKMIDKNEKETKPLKIAILGTARCTVGDAPFKDESWEIWGLSTRPKDLPRVTRWYEIHDLKRKKRVHPEYYEWMTQTDIPVYLDVADPNVKTGIVGWREPIIKRFEKFFHQDGYLYMTNSISWMIGHAILEIEANGGAGEIGLWGVDMSIGSLVMGGDASEYAHQRPSCEYWIGLAQGLGIDVTVPGACNLLKCREMYGFDTDQRAMYERIIARNKEISDKTRQANAQLEEQKETVQRLRGGLVTLDNLLREGNGVVTREQVEQVRRHLDIAMEREMKVLADCNNFKFTMQGAASNQEWIEQNCPAGQDIFDG